MKRNIQLIFALLAFSQVIALTNLKEEVAELSMATDEPRDLFQEHIDLHHAQVAEELDAAHLAEQKKVEQIVGASKYVCTNGKKPSSLSRKDYVKQFNKGPCAPTVLLAGISGTKLMVTVDCETFKRNHPTDFNQCWSTCSGSGAPAKEYRIWIPSVASPMSILHPSQKKKNCFTNLIGWDVAKVAKDGSTQYRKGLRVYPMGLSPGTKTNATSRCGMDAITDLVPTKIQFSGFSQYRTLVKLFEAAGYKNGINLQALPYDWRLDYRETALKTKFKSVVRKMYENTGKKTMIVAHSFGNM